MYDIKVHKINYFNYFNATCRTSQLPESYIFSFVCIEI